MNKYTKIMGQEMEDLKGYMKLGYTSSEATKLVLQSRKLLKQKEDNKELINNWNTGGFISDDKYKQPVKHKLYK